MKKCISVQIFIFACKSILKKRGEGRPRGGEGRGGKGSRVEGEETCFANVFFCNPIKLCKYKIPENKVFTV